MFKKIFIVTFIVVISIGVLGCDTPTTSDGDNANSAPVASFADADYIVSGEGLSDVNGLYQETGTSFNPSSAKYDKISGTFYTLHQFTPDGVTVYWAIHTSVAIVNPPLSDVTFYAGYATNPPDSGWTTSFSPDPVVYSYPIHVDDLSGGYYTVSAYYEYFDEDGDAEGNTKYAWYNSSDNINWNLLENDTNYSYDLSSGTGYIKVLVTPVDAFENEGLSIEYSREIDP